MPSLLIWRDRIFVRSWGLILKVCILLWLFLIPFLEKILGQDGERLAIFETPMNVNDAWHGYPFFSKDEYKLTDEIVDKFKEKEKISIANYTRLLARKI